LHLGIFVSAELFWDNKGKRVAEGRVEHELLKKAEDNMAPAGSRQHHARNRCPQTMQL